MAALQDFDMVKQKLKVSREQMANHRDEALIILHEAIKKSKSEPFKKTVSEAIKTLDSMVHDVDYCVDRFIETEENQMNIRNHDQSGHNDQDAMMQDEGELDDEEEAPSAASAAGFGNDSGMQHEEDHKAYYVLGIEVGLQACKLSVIHSLTHEIIEQHATIYKPEEVNRSDIPPTHHQQSVDTLLKSIQDTLRSFNKDILARVNLIGICGQMQGILLWHTQEYFPWIYCPTTKSYQVVTSQTSDLITGQDQRCDENFLSSLPKPKYYPFKVSSGSGCATLFWLQAHDPEFIAKYNCSGTIMDFIVAVLCNFVQPVISEQNATSWGYFDINKRQWDTESLTDKQFPVHLLPTPLPVDASGGHLSHEWCGIRAGTLIMVAMGDVQCTAFAHLNAHPRSAVLNINESMQLYHEKPKHIPLPRSESELRPGMDFIPYFGQESTLCLADPLKGGNLMQLVVKSFKSLIKSIASDQMSEKELWARITRLSQKLADEAGSGTPVSSPQKPHVPRTSQRPQAGPSFQDPATRSSSPSTSDGINVEQILTGLSIGLIDNLLEMMPKESLRNAGIDTIVGTGSALLSNSAVKKSVETKFAEFNVLFSEGTDANVGAAKAVLKFHKALQAAQNTSS